MKLTVKRGTVLHNGALLGVGETLDVPSETGAMLVSEGYCTITGGTAAKKEKKESTAAADGPDTGMPEEK